MKSNPPQDIATAQKIQKKENAQDIISMSIKRLCEEKSRIIEKIYDVKFGFTIGYSMGSKSKTETMKSYENIKKGSADSVKKTKKENALDIISKSLQAIMKANCLNGPAVY